MKPMLFALCLGLAVPSGVRAFVGDSPPPGGEDERDQSPEKFAEGLTKGLELDAKQSEKVKALFKESQERSKSKRAEMKALQEKMKGLHKEMMSEMRRLEEGIRGELTLEQKDRFDMMRLRRRGGRGGGGGGGEREERREMRERREGGGPGKGRRSPDLDDDDGPRRFPPEMWHEKRGESGGGPGEGRGGEPPETPDGD